MSFRSGTRFASTGLVGLALALAACNSATAPASLADPVATAAQAAALDSAFGAPVLGSFQSLGSSIHPAPPIARVAISAVPRPGIGTDRYAALAAFGRELRQVVPSFASLAAPTIFADSLKQSVFSWNTSTGSYSRSATTGGPVNGIRFLLYAINPLTNQPATPLTQVGYVDLMDESANGTARLHIQVKNTAGTTTYLDYTFSGSGSSTSFTASVAGTITNGLAGTANKTLTFNVTITGSSSSLTLTSAYTLNSPAVTVAETLTVTDNGTTTTLTLDFTFTRTGETVNIAGTIAVSDADGSGTVNLTFKVNGSTYATLTGTTTSVTFTKSGGGQLTTDEQNALRQLFLAAADMSNKVGDIFAPAQRLLGF